MAAQAASTNNRRVTRSSTPTTTTTTTLTPSTKAYTTPPSSQAIHPSSSSSSSSAVAPTLVDAFASLAVEVPPPQQQQEVALQPAEPCSQNASQLAESRSAIATQSAELHSLTAAQLAEPRPLASARPTRTNRRDDNRQQGSLESGTKAHSDPVDRLVKGIGAVRIHQPPASTHPQTTSPPVPATPVKQKRGRSDYEEEIPIDERLANLYLDPPPPPPPLPPPATLTSASTSTLAVTQLSTTTKTTTSTSISHSHPAKTSSSKDITSSADTPANVEAHGEPHQEIPLPHLIEHRMLRLYNETQSILTDTFADNKACQRLIAEMDELYDLRIMSSIFWMNKNPGSILGYGVFFSFGQQGKGSKRSKSQLEADEARVDIALHSLRAARQYRKLVAAARTCESRQRHDAYRQYRYAQSTEPARIELERKYEQASEQYKTSRHDAWIKATQQHRQLSRSYHQTPSQYKQGYEDLFDLASSSILLMDPGVVPSSLLDFVGGSSREDKGKTSKDHERRKRVKHDDIKQEPVDEKMSDATTASTPFSTTTSAASTTSTHSTLSGHNVADVTVDMQHKLTFSPTTATSQ